ncbi:Rz1-like lysis system protein LysC [Providencia rettgeri]|uniref:Rz1-like lysis system protein LysC n=1 Tax=Providencia rettgeri TaxID=587 RepID=UPI003C7E1770
MSALILLFPMMLLVSCGNTKEVLTPVHSVPIPAQLTADCPQPDVPEHMDWKDMPQLLVDSMNSIAKCNLDKKAIREIEQQRNAPNIGAKRE